jgi:hypothetical protein
MALPHMMSVAARPKESPLSSSARATPEWSVVSGPANGRIDLDTVQLAEPRHLGAQNA